MLLTPTPKSIEIPREYTTPILDENSKLIFCWIQKNMCTQIKYLFARHLFGFNGTAGEDQQSLDLIHNYYSNIMVVWNFSTIRSHMTDSTYKKWAIIRCFFCQCSQNRF